MQKRKVTNGLPKYSVVKNESKNIEVSTNVILTEISVYNVR